MQGPDGREAYTRAGDLQLSANGLLQTRVGMNVLGEGGPITAPPNSEVTIGGDGTVSVIPTDTTPNAVDIVGRIKLVNPPAEGLDRGEDGLFRLRDGTDAPADASVQVSSGSLETSNVNIADAMVTMIELARHFELQVKAMRTAEETAGSSSQLLRMT